MAEEPEVILITEGWLASLVRDAGIVAMFVSLIGIGVFLESAAMQWAGAILGFLVIIALSTRMQRQTRMTISTARKRLDEIEAGE